MTAMASKPPGRLGRFFGYGLEDIKDRRRSFFWTVLFVGFFPAILFWMVLRRLFAILASLFGQSWRDFQASRRDLPRVTHSLSTWARPSAPIDVSTQVRNQAFFVVGWLILTVLSAALAVFRPDTIGGPLVLGLFSFACLTRVVAHVVTWRWLTLKGGSP